MNGMKTCRSCGDTKPLDAFYTHRGAADGHRSDCKRCFIDRQLQTYRGRKETGRVTVRDLPRAPRPPARDWSDYVAWLGAELQRFALDHEMAIGVSGRVNWCVRHCCAVERDQAESGATVAWCEHCLDELEQEMRRLAEQWREARESLPRVPRRKLRLVPLPVEWERAPIEDEFLELLEA